MLQNEKEIDFLSTEAIDYPCSLRKVGSPPLCGVFATGSYSFPPWISHLAAPSLPPLSPQEFDTACALTASILQRVLGGGGGGGGPSGGGVVALTTQRIDDGGVEGEPCAGRRCGDARAVPAPCSTASACHNTVGWRRLCLPPCLPAPAHFQ